VDTSKGMVRVNETTYRIVECNGRIDVVRLLDDRRVGSFRHRPKLEILECAVEPRELVRVIGHAMQRAKIPSLSSTRSNQWAMMHRWSAKLVQSIVWLKPFLPSRWQLTRPVWLGHWVQLVSGPARRIGPSLKRMTAEARAR